MGVAHDALSLDLRTLADEPAIQSDLGLIRVGSRGRLPFWSRMARFCTQSRNVTHLGVNIVEEQRFRQCRLVPVRMAQGRFGVQARRWLGRSCSR